MKSKINKATFVLMLLLGIIIMSNKTFHADEWWDSFKGEESDFFASFNIIWEHKGFDYAAKNAISLYNDGTYSKSSITNVLSTIAAQNPSYMQQYVDMWNTAGIPVTINGGSSSLAEVANTNNGTQISSKTEYNVTDVEPYPAWTTQDCNIRTGADTTYDKSGSLKIHEKVTVTGVATTGWFRIQTESGQEAYISNTLLTTEDPNNVSFSTVDDNGNVTDFTVEGENAEAVAEVVEKIKEGTLSEGKEVEKVEIEVHEHYYTAEVITEATCTQTGTMKYTCECGETYTEEIPKTDHTSGEWEVAKKATFTSAGLEELACTNCGTVIESREIPANSNLLYGIVIGAAFVVILGLLVFVRKKQSSRL